MYVQSPVYDIEAFLRAADFITPANTTLDFFVVPSRSNFVMPPNSQYTPQQMPDETITYRRTEPLMKHDMATPPIEYSHWAPPKIGRKQPATSRTPEVTEPDDLESPFLKVLSENEKTPEVVVLKEKWQMFPKGTIFNFKKMSLREGRGNYEGGFIKALSKKAEELNGQYVDCRSLQGVDYTSLVEEIASYISFEFDDSKLTVGKHYSVATDESEVKSWKENLWDYAGPSNWRENGYEDPLDIPDDMNAWKIRNLISNSRISGGNAASAIARQRRM